MFPKSQLQPPTDKQLAYIHHLEHESHLKFYGTTKREARIFIERANKAIVDNQIIANQIKRQDEKWKRMHS